LNSKQPLPIVAIYCEDVDMYTEARELLNLLCMGDSKQPHYKVCYNETPTHTQPLTVIKLSENYNPEENMPAFPYEGLLTQLLDSEIPLEPTVRSLLKKACATSDDELVAFLDKLYKEAKRMPGAEEVRKAFDQMWDNANLDVPCDGSRDWSSLGFQVPDDPASDFAVPSGNDTLTWLIWFAGRRSFHDLGKQCEQSKITFIPLALQCYNATRSLVLARLLDEFLESDQGYVHLENTLWRLSEFFLNQLVKQKNLNDRILPLICGFVIKKRDYQVLCFKAEETPGSMREWCIW